MRVKLSSIILRDQDHAPRFYTETLGFVKKTDVPAGKYRWLTVVSPEGPDDLELLLEPDEHLASKAYQSALYESGIPLTWLFTSDFQSDYQRLTGLGVQFKMAPTNMGPVTVGIFDDTCGNLIQLVQA